MNSVPSRTRIRTAVPEDADALLKIYGPYVKETAITFEYEVPSTEEFTARIKNTLKHYPYLVAEQDGKPIGYAYTGPFVGRAACSWAAETSIYLNRSAVGSGIGRKLYEALENISKLQNFLNLNAAVAYPGMEDSYLTKNSVQFHEHMGYKPVGIFHKCGYKFGTWYDLMWMEKWLGPHTGHPAPVIPFPELEAKIQNSNIQNIEIKEILGGRS